jgi:outer membrane protein assembly factor BamB
MKTKKLLFIIILSLFLLCLVALLLIYFQIQKRNQPPGTIQTGIFNSQPAWTYETSENITSTPAVDDNGRVYIRTSNSIIALDAPTGTLLWRAELPGKSPLSISPQAFGDYLVAPATDSQIAVFSTGTGQMVWISPIIDPPYGRPSDIEVEAFSVTEGLLIVARHNWMLTSYKIEDGQVVWEQDITHASIPYMVIDRNNIYLGSGSLLQAYDAKNGNLLWQKELVGYLGQMLIADNPLYITEEKYASLLAIDPDSQEILWRKYYPVYIDGFKIECLSFFDDMLYIATEKMLALSTDGEVIWASKKTGLLECPAFLDNSMYVRNIGTTLYAFDTKSGEEKGQMNVKANTNLQAHPDRSPIVFDKFLIVPVSDHQIIAYQP